MKHVQDKPLDNANENLHMCNIVTVKPVWKCRKVVRSPANGKKYNVEFQVIKKNFTPLLSKNAAQQMQLITINYDNFKVINLVQKDSTENIIKKYSNVFDDKVLGCFPGEVHLRLSSEAKAVQIW